MLDVGTELEPERQRVVELLRASGDARDPAMLAGITGQTRATTEGIPTKYAYGSDFAYRADFDGVPAIEAQGVDLSPSFAKGGLSNVWGAAVLPYTSGDTADWPVTLEDLAPHYAAVLEFVSVAAERDDLVSILPLYGRESPPLRPSQQAAALMADLSRNKEILNRNGFVFGRSRLAVAAQSPYAVSGCVYCGLCLHGCPYELIYNSAHTLRTLEGRGHFRYLKGLIVREVSEHAGRVDVHALSVDGKERVRLEASRVFLACGPISTTQIVLESLRAYDQVVRLKDSQYFLFPLLRYRNTPRVAHEQLHTLAQAFIEVLDRHLSDKTIHLQVYTYNDLYRTALGRLGRVRRGPIHWVLSALLGRLLIVQGYLHSDLSSTIAVHLAKGPRGSTLRLDAQPSPVSLDVIARLLAKLSANRRYFRAAPLRPLLRVARPGRGFHSGGTFPMRQNPSALDSDLLGRPAGLQRVHIVDSACFPSIPATTITFSVMANAHRIASICDGP
jgi:choline dehydrogenase-like flavoprotein